MGPSIKTHGMNPTSLQSSYLNPSSLHTTTRSARCALPAPARQAAHADLHTRLYIKILIADALLFRRIVHAAHDSAARITEIM